ncbi:O-6-methylguanine DNA methyltransferase [Desulfosporosinus acidiphilus SJ4]|uniref:Methylated-DNA--protein-cysteine methyltransferase n=1 Tax=Desulfosporosinus acidiphilus (strain DSM 22704 / JCM 16185 / SJ4) TaxID=646529 RepID=I4D1W7_DESAJ|nr:DVU0298 family protein [Desulfosporosinus acidiphilus]AFM39791.1 O-6-methylguanine DNA methyltransferase [Desulfosporosinus acidiphilus SJ4]
MTTKRDLEHALESRDWEQLISLAKENRNVLRKLMARIYVKDGLMFWRAVEGIGVVAHALEQEDRNFAVEILRRYFWMLNEESGGTAWNSSEAIGSIIAHCPVTCGKFNWMLSGLLEDESLRDGVLWGIGQMALNAPHLVEPLDERIKPFLLSEEPLTRGLTAFIYRVMMPFQELMPLYRESGPKWKVPEDIDTRLENDKNLLEFYQDGELKKFSVSDLWKAHTISFWTKKVTIKDLETELTIASSEEGVCWLSLGSSETEEQELRTWVSRWFPKSFLTRRREPNSRAIQELKEYFEGNRRDFTIPIHSQGTPFQQKVWEELRRIPYGETRSYGELAVNLGNPKGQRAVGMANHCNPIGIIVPCHRVIGKNGSLTGYAGGLDIKQRLLELEGSRP